MTTKRADRTTTFIRAGVITMTVGGIFATVGVMSPAGADAPVNDHQVSICHWDATTQTWSHDHPAKQQIAAPNGHGNHVGDIIPAFVAGTHGPGWGDYSGSEAWLADPAAGDLFLESCGLPAGTDDGGDDEGSTGGDDEGSTGGDNQGSTGGDNQGSTGGDDNGSSGGDNNGSTGGDNQGSTGGDNNGSTGGDNQGSTGGDNNGSTGGDNQGSTGGDNQGSTGGDNNGSTGGDNQGSTGGDNQGSTGGDDNGTPPPAPVTPGQPQTLPEVVDRPVVQPGAVESPAPQAKPVAPKPVEVLGAVIRPAGQTLPRTGTDTLPLAELGFALVLVGAASMLVSRRMVSAS